MDVVCTAGHVDHGKSTLVRALTGMEPDRFDEEQRRGLTIDLGFAWTRLGGEDDGRTVAFVDLPGHERFIANMLAGAGPVEAAMFVVAADEGWKPQSQEHLEILDLLEITTGVVAVTKADAVTPEQVESVRASVSGRGRGTCIEGWETVTVSGATGDGLDELRAALVRALGDRPAPQDRGRPRLWVDRSFTIKGAGTVVTGTLTGGALQVGDEVVVRPGGTGARVRGLQSLQETVAAAAAGDRVAVNLAAVARDAVRRGHTVTHPDATPATTAVDTWLRVLGDVQVKRRGAWHLHAGSGEWPVRLRPLPGTTIDRDGFTRVLFVDAVPLEAGDRFVLRDSGRRVTAAGGVVLDVDPTPLGGGVARSERVAQLARRRAALADDDRGVLLALHVAERGAAPRQSAAAATGLHAGAAADAAKRAGLPAVGDYWVHPTALSQWTAAVTAALLTYHQANPLQRTAPRDVAARAAVSAGAPAPAVGDLLAGLGRLGRIVVDGPAVRHPDHDVALSPADRGARDALVAALAAQPFSPPPLADAAARAGASTALVRELEASGELVRLNDNIAVTSQTVQLAAQRLRELAGREGPFTAAQARSALDTTRKYAVPLLEELDRRGITRREGDIRHIR